MIAYISISDLSSNNFNAELVLAEKRVLKEKGVRSITSRHASDILE